MDPALVESMRQLGILLIAISVIIIVGYVLIRIFSGFFKVLERIPTIVLLAIVFFLSGVLLYLLTQTIFNETILSPFL